MLNRNMLFSATSNDYNKIQSEDSFVCELVALCQQVYKGNDRPPLPDGWKLFREYAADSHDDNGYYGACYIKKIWDLPISYYHVVFAHRGTIISFSDVGSSIENIIADINVSLGHVPSQFYNAKKFVLKTLDEIKDKFNYNCIQTGHSLGAIIADLLSVLKDPCPFYCSSYTFDNPGSKPIIEAMIISGELAPDAIDRAKKANQAYQSNPNLINTCNEQASKVFMIDFNKWNYDVLDGPIIPIPSNFFLNLYYVFGYTPERHAIKTIYSALKENGDCNESHEWPYGFKDGYKRYLSDDDIGGGRGYWSGYAKEIWQKRPDIQEEYHWYYRHFYLDFLDFLRQTRNELTNLTSNKSTLFSQDKKANSIDAIISEFVIINYNPQNESKRCTII